MPRFAVAKKLGRSIQAVGERASLFRLQRPRQRYINYVTGKPLIRVDDVTGCWIWIGCLNKKGYAVGRGENTTLVYRQAWIDRHGPVPEGFTVDHTCRRRACVNEDHLEAVPHIVNVRRGGKTRLTVALVEEIRGLLASHSDRKIARIYGVSDATIWFIRKGVTWK